MAQAPWGGAFEAKEKSRAIGFTRLPWRSDGTLWFTDPTYGIMGEYEGDKAAPEQPVRGVYRVDPAIGEITRVIDDFTQPNGLAFSPDEPTLSVYAL